MDRINSGKFEEIIPEGMDKIWNFVAAGNVLDGLLEEVKPDQGKNKNSNLYTLSTDDGSRVKVWGTKVLDDRMVQVHPGDIVRITYKGLVEGKNGGNDWHNFSVDKLLEI